MDQTGLRTQAAQGQRAITGRSGVPVTCGGLQPDPPGQPAQLSGGDGMTSGPKAGRARSTFCEESGSRWSPSNRPIKGPRWHSPLLARAGKALGHALWRLFQQPLRAKAEIHQHRRPYTNIFCGFAGFSLDLSGRGPQPKSKCRQGFWRHAERCWDAPGRHSKGLKTEGVSVCNGRDRLLLDDLGRWLPPSVPSFIPSFTVCDGWTELEAPDRRGTRLRLGPAGTGRRLSRSWLGLRADPQPD